MTSLDTASRPSSSSPLIDTKVDDEDMFIIRASESFLPDSQLVFADDSDVLLILFHHQTSVLLHSQILRIHSMMLKSLLGVCIDQGRHVIILARTPDDTLSKIKLNYTLAIFQAMYNYSVFQERSQNYSFGAWRSILQLDKFLDLKVLGNQFRKQFMDVIHQYPEGPLRGKELSATDFVIGGFPEFPVGTSIKKVYAIMNNCKDWFDNKQVHTSLCTLFPSPECWIYFQQWSISTMVCTLNSRQQLSNLIEAERKRDRSFIDNKVVETCLNDGPPYSTLFNWFYAHAYTCPHCVEQKRIDTERKKRKAESELEHKE